MFEGLRVLEAGHGVPGPMTGMILGDLGAEVIKVEGPAGDPFAGLPAYQTWNRNKVITRLDLRTEEGKAKLHSLLAGADVFIDSSALLLGSRQYAPRELLSSYPDLVVCSISAFPPGMPLDHLPAWDPLMAARAGIFDKSPVGSDVVEPRQTQLPMASTMTALVSAHAIAGALRMRDLTGKGQTVRISMMDALFQVLGLKLVRANWTGEAVPRRTPSRLTGQYLCADGRWIQVVPQGSHVPEFLKVMGLWPEFDADSLRDPHCYERARAKLAQIIAKRPSFEWERVLSNAGLCGVTCNEPVEWLLSEQARESRLSIAVETPLGEMWQPGPLLHDCRSSFTAPEIPEDLDEVDWRAARRRELPASKAPGGAPLEGIRVLDMSMVLAGPTCGRLLGEMGAEVIKIDGPDTLPSDGIWLDGNRGKWSMGIDLKTDEGRRVMWDLVDSADVIIENFSAGTAERLGFGYEAISARNPRIVYVHLTCFGHGGPMAGWHGWEHSAQAVTGLQVREANDHGQPQLMPMPLSDYGSAYAAALGVIGALRAREVTGKGTLVRTSLVAPMGLVQSMYLNHFPGKRWRAQGEASSSVSHVLRCSDGYVYAQCPAERWFSYMSRCFPDLDEGAEAPALMFSHIPSDEALTRLSSAHIPAVRMHSVWSLYDDDEIRSTGLIRTTVDPAFGVVDHVGKPYHASWVNAGEGAVVPLPGEHTRDVLRELGYSPAGIARLLDEGAVLEGSGLVS